RDSRRRSSAGGSTPAAATAPRHVASRPGRRSASDSPQRLRDAAASPQRRRPQLHAEGSDVSSWRATIHVALAASRPAVWWHQAARRGSAARRRGIWSRPMAATHQLSAHELVSAYGKGELPPVEVARAALARIDTWEPKINAMYRMARDAALEQARESEARWRKAAPRSALDGVPITIKENIVTRGDPAPLGARCNED